MFYQEMKNRKFRSGLLERINKETNGWELKEN